MASDHLPGRARTRAVLRRRGPGLGPALPRADRVRRSSWSGLRRPIRGCATGFDCLRSRDASRRCAGRCVDPCWSTTAGCSPPDRRGRARRRFTRRMDSYTSIRERKRSHGKTLGGVDCRPLRIAAVPFGQTSTRQQPLRDCGPVFNDRKPWANGALPWGSPSGGIASGTFVSLALARPQARLFEPLNACPGRRRRSAIRR
jgi:hypothetical protein